MKDKRKIDGEYYKLFSGKSYCKVLTCNKRRLKGWTICRHHLIAGKDCQCGDYGCDTIARQAKENK